MIDLWLSLLLSSAPTIQDTAPGPGVQASDSCARCHSNAETATAMRDAAGRPVAPHDLWRGTLMANAARDPLWRAFVSAEVAQTPSRQAEIEATCLGCHAPMAARLGLDDHGTGSLMHVLDCDAPLGDLARDGVSCTVCHGMAADGLGTPATYSGRFQLDAERRLFGPHANPFAMPMRAHTGFTPTFGAHVAESSACGSCHTLETEALAPDGTALGVMFLEQAPYLEWRNSAFDTEREAPGSLAASCQGCHMPTRDVDGAAISTRIARNPGGRDFPPVRPREPFGRHAFVGGNAWMLELFRDHGEALRAEAPAASFDALAQAAREQLQQRTADVSIQGVQVGPAALTFEVAVQNRTGHKFPTAHPTRRAWLHVRVLDAGGGLLFESGGADAAGRLLGPDGEPLPSERAGGPVAPHVDVVRQAGDVARFRAVPADVDGTPTHSLMRAASWWVDDRLLPAGWDPEHPEAERTAPVGAGGDASFGPGGDRVRYELELAGAERIEVELLYQPLGARWAAELDAHDTPEVAALRALTGGTAPRPETVDRASWSADDR